MRTCKTTLPITRPHPAHVRAVWESQAVLGGPAASQVLVKIAMQIFLFFFQSEKNIVDLL